MRFIQKKIWWPKEKTKAAVSKKYLNCIIYRDSLATSQHSHHRYWGIYHTGAPTFVCLYNENLLTASGAMKSLPSIPHCHCENIFLPPGEMISCSREQGIWGNWLESFEIVKSRLCKTACHTLSISSGIIRDGQPSQSSLCLLVWPSVNCPHHHLTILESLCWQETISVQPFSVSAVQ